MSKIGTMPLQFSNANSRVSVTLHLDGTVNLKSVVYSVIVMCLSHHVNYLIDEAVVSHFHSHVITRPGVPSACNSITMTCYLSNALYSLSLHCHSIQFFMYNL